MQFADIREATYFTLAAPRHGRRSKRRPAAPALYGVRGRAESYPGGGVVAGLLPTADLAVHAGVGEPLRDPGNLDPRPGGVTTSG
jgi:hypothetical protein